MANTFELIASSTVGSGGSSSIDFTSIASTYTDLCVKISVRGNLTNTNDPVLIAFNGSSANFSTRQVQGNGSTASSATTSTGRVGYLPDAGSTASTFSNIEVYIPNYAGSNNKSYSSDSVQENNSGAAGDSLVHLIAGLWSQTAAINRITISSATENFVQYSTAYLYGVKNA